MPYNAGTVFLQVVPSLHGIEGAMRRAVRDAGRSIGKSVDDGLKSTERQVAKRGKDSAEEYAGAFDRELRKRIRTSIDSLPPIRPDVDHGALDTLVRRLQALRDDLDLDVDLDAGRAMAELASLRAAAEAVAEVGDLEIDVRTNAGAMANEVAALEKYVQRVTGEEARRRERARQLDQAEERRAKATKRREREEAGAARDARRRELADDKRQRRAWDAQFQAAKKHADDLIKEQKRAAKEAAVAREKALLERERQEREAAARSVAIERERQREVERSAGLLSEYADGRRARRRPYRARRSDRRDLRRAAEAVLIKLPPIEITADSSQVDREYAEIRAGFEAIQNLEIKTHVDAARARAEIESLEERLARLGAREVDIKVDVDTAQAIAQLKMVERQAQRTERLDAAAGAANSFRVFNGVLLTTVTLGAALIPIIATLAVGIAGLATAALMALPAFAALGFGFAGIGDALTALQDVEEEQGKASRTAARDAARNARGIRDAQRALARAREDAARSIESAARRQERAERALADAQREALEVQVDLAQAREDARRDIEDQNNRLESLRLQIRQAEYDLQETAFSLNNALADPGATQRERELAQLAYDREVQALKEMRTEYARLSGDTAEANEKGVEGHDLVVDAQQRQVDALERVRDAQQEVADAAVEMQRTQADAAYAIEQAQIRVADAIEDASARSAEGLLASSAAVERLNTAMEGLSPAGRTFATFLHGLRGDLEEIQAIAAEGLLPGVQDFITTLLDEYGPDLQRFIGDMARLFGEGFRILGDTLTSPQWRSFFETVERYAPTFLRQFGDIFLSIATGLAGFFEAFAPYAEEMGDFFVDLFREFAEWGQGLGDNSGFHEFMDYMREQGPKVLKLFGLLLEFIVDLGIALEPFADRLLDGMISFLEWLTSLKPRDLALIAGAILSIIAGIQVLAGLVATISGIAGLVTSVGVIATFLAGLGGAAAAAAGTLAVIVGVVAAIAAIVAGVILLYNNVEWFRDLVDTTYERIGAAAERMWFDFLQPVFSAIQGWYEDIIQPVLDEFGRQWDKTWGFISGVMQVAYDVLSTIGNMIGQIFTHIIGPAWEQLYTTFIEPIWVNYIQPVFRALADIWNDYIVPAWQEGVRILGSIWDGIREALAAPIRWAIETVINDGLIGSFNWLADRVPGMTPVEEIDVPAALQPRRRGGGGGRAYAAMADGGVLPGYTPGRDVHRFVSPTGGVLDLSGGEAILRPEVTRALGADWIHGVNRAARTGRGLERYLGGFAGGGILEDIGRWVAAAARTGTDVITGVGRDVAKLFTDPGQALRDLVQSLFRAVPGGETDYMRVASALPTAAAGGMGDFIKSLITGTGTQAGGADGRPGMAYQWMVPLLKAAFPGIRITSTYRPGAITAVGTRSYHGLGRAVDMTPSMDIFNWISSNYPDSRELLFSPAGSRQIVGGKRRDTGGITRAMHYDHVHWAYQKGGILPRLYDQGGYLPTGLSLIENRTGKPEMVLPPELTERVERGGLGDTYNLEVPVSVNASPDEIAAALMRRIRRQSRGGVYARRS